MGAANACGASSREQARLVFETQCTMIAMSPALQKLGLRVLKNTITFERTHSKSYPIPAKSSALFGKNLHCIILDELHVVKQATFDALVTGQGARDNPLFFTMTTAGIDVTDVGYHTHDEMVKILRNDETAESTFAMIFTLDDLDDPFDEQIWLKANPSLGITPKLDKFRQDAATAQRSGSHARFEIYQCNLWRSAAGWIDLQI